MEARSSITEERQEGDGLTVNEQANSTECPPTKKRKIVHSNEDGLAWAQTVPSSRLDLMISIKELAMERMNSIGDPSLAGIFTWKSLDCIGIILEEFMKEQLVMCPSLICSSSEELESQKNKTTR